MLRLEYVGKQNSFIEGKRQKQLRVLVLGYSGRAKPLPSQHLCLSLADNPKVDCKCCQFANDMVCGICLPTFASGFGALL